MSAHCRVLVVGAGPVGLFAGLCADHERLSVKVLDEFWRSDQRGHTALLHGQSVSLLSSYGLGSELDKYGLELNRLSLRIDNRLMASIPLEQPALALPQRSLERALLQELRRRDVEVLMAQKAYAFKSHRHQVDVTVGRREAALLGSPAAYAEWAEVERSTVSAHFVVGADGHESTVRQALGTRFLAQQHADSYTQFEFECPTSNLEREIAVSLQGGLDNVIFPLPEGRMRVAFQNVVQPAHESDRTRLKELLGWRMPWFKGEIGNVDFARTIQFEPRFVDHFGKQRIWLAGDAAHTSGPIGAQSLNVGLLEAKQLVDEIADVELRDASMSSMATRLNADCRETWQTLLGGDHDALMPDPTPGWLIGNAAQVISALPASGEHLRELLALLAKGTVDVDSTHFGSDRRVPTSSGRVQNGS